MGSPKTTTALKLHTPSNSNQSMDGDHGPSISEEVRTTHLVAIQSDSSKRKRKRKIHPYKLVVLPTDIPQSIIVYGLRDDDDENIAKYIAIATDLYKKYVEIGSELEINVGYSMRCGIHAFIEENANGQADGIEDKLYLLFDGCRKELY